MTRATIPPSSRANQAHDGRTTPERVGVAILLFYRCRARPERPIRRRWTSRSALLLGPLPQDLEEPWRPCDPACRPGDGRSRDRIDRSSRPRRTRPPYWAFRVSAPWPSDARSLRAFPRDPIAPSWSMEGPAAADSSPYRPRIDVRRRRRATTGHRRGQLPAGGVDLGPPGHPDGGVDARAPPAGRGIAARRPREVPTHGVAGRGVERDQVDVGAQRAGERRRARRRRCSRSLTPSIMAHSMESRRPLAVTYSAQASARSASG